MVQLTKIYTRGGDAGETSLGSGDRVSKNDTRVAAYGTVDETNAAIGIARLHAAEAPNADAMLARIQNDLFDLGADLCTPEGDTRAASKQKGALRIAPAQVELSPAAFLLDARRQVGNLQLEVAVGLDRHGDEQTDPQKGKANPVS